MKPSEMVVAVAAGVLCFAAGWWTGNGQDHWKIANQASCMGNVQVIEVPLTPVQPSKIHGILLDPRYLRLQQIGGAFQQIERCNSLSGLATLDPLVEKRLYSMINR